MQPILSTAKIFFFALLMMGSLSSVAQIDVATNFRVGAAIPVDTRDTLTNLADTANITAGLRYPGLLTYVRSVDQYWHVKADGFFYQLETGGGSSSLSANLDANNYKITELGNPTNPYDAANMNYVDQQVATATDNQTAEEVSYDNTDSGSPYENVKLVLDDHESRLKSLEGDTITQQFGLVYYPFNDTTRITRYGEANADIYISDPLGSNVCEGKAINVNWTNTGLAGFEVPLDTINSDTLYITYYINIADNDNLSAMSYTQIMSINVGPGDTGTEVFDLIPRFNQAGNSVDHVARFGEYDFLQPRVGYGCFVRHELMLDLVGSTYTITQNNQVTRTGSLGSNLANYLFFGASLAAGFHIQVQHLTIDTTGFAPDYTAAGDAKLVGSIPNTYYLRNTGVDSTVFQYDISYLYDPDGGTNYLNGPALYFSQLNNKNVGRNDSVYILIHAGDTIGLKDLTVNERLIIEGTPASIQRERAIVDRYGNDLFANPVVTSSVGLEENRWVDEGDNIYSYSFTTTDTTDRFSYVFCKNCKNIIEESYPFLGLRNANFEAPDSISVMDTIKKYPGTYYLKGSKLFLRMYDDTAPNSIFVRSIDNFSMLGKGSIIRNIDAVASNIGTAVEGLTEFCNVSFGGTLGVGKLGVLRYCTVTNLDLGSDYYVNGTGQNTTSITNSGGAYTAQAPYALTLQDSAIAYANLIEGGSIGVQFTFATIGSILSHNIIKNSKITTIQISGSPTTKWDFPAAPVRIINNTIFYSPKIKDNNPYPLEAPQPGHAFIFQAGVDKQNYEHINNAYFVNPQTAAAKGVLSYGANITTRRLISDYNYLELSKATDTINYESLFLARFDSLRAQYVTSNFSGIDGQPFEGNSNMQPFGMFVKGVRVANVISGDEWLATNPRLNSDSPLRGAGYIYQYPQWAIDKIAEFGGQFTDYYGKPLSTIERSIGAVEYED